MTLENEKIVKWTLVLSRPLREPFSWGHDKTIESAVNQVVDTLELVGSGAGFGYRDVEFDGQVTEEQAKSIAEMASFMTGIKIEWKLYSIVEDEIDDQIK